MRELWRLATTLAVVMAAALSGCTAVGTHGSTPAGRVTHGSPGVRSSSNPAAASGAPPAVPNPFTVVARYSASSLGLKEPADLAIAPDGNLYVTDASQHVTVISPRGKVLRRWGGRGTAEGRFHFIRPEGPEPGRPVSAGIAVGADGKVYVSDSGNARVEIFSPSGEFLGQFGSRGAGQGQFLVGPRTLAVDADGNVYVSDVGVSKFSPSGEFEWRIGDPADGPTDPDLVGVHIDSSSIDAHGRLVLANDDKGRVVYIDSEGREIDAFGEGSAVGHTGTFREGVCSATVDEAGDTYVTSCQEPLIPPHYTEVFDRTDRLLGAWFPSAIGWSPRFGPNGEVFALGDDGSILQLKVALPDA